MARDPLSRSGPHNRPTGKAALPLVWEVAGARGNRRHLGLVSPERALAVPAPGGGINVEPQEARPGVAEMCEHAGPWAGCLFCLAWEGSWWAF